MTEPTFRQCRDCDFWVTRHERFCPNCGIGRPFIPFKQPRVLVSVEPPGSRPTTAVGYSATRGAVVGGLLGGILTLAFSNLGGPGVLEGQAAGAVPLAAFGVLPGGVLGWFVDHKVNSAGVLTGRRAAQHLCLYERQVRDRLRDLSARRARLTIMKNRVLEELDPGAAAAAESALMTADAALADQEASYRNRSREIEGFRLRNVLTAAFSDLEVLSLGRLRRRLNAIDMCMGRAEDLIEAHHLADGDTVSLRELRSLLAVGEKVQQAGSAREAVLEVCAISVVDPPPTPLNLPAELVATMHQLSARAEIDELGRAFRDLEADFNRLATQRTPALASGVSGD